MSRYPLARWSPSPSFSHGRAHPPTLVVIHITDGGPNYLHTVESFQKPENQKSAHFVIGRNGEIAQLVDLNDRAWHDSGRNGQSIGIEHSARTPGEFDRKWAGLSEHTRKALLPDGVGFDSPTDPGMPLTEPQLVASARLVAWLLQSYHLPITAVVPHCSNNESSHKDCGLDIEDGGIWPWARYRELIESLKGESND